MSRLSIAVCCLIIVATDEKRTQRVGALAFVTALTSRNSRTNTAIFGTEGAESQLETSLISSKYDKYAIYDAHFKDYIALGTARKEDLGSLLSVCRELQNSPDYQPAEWADSCRVIEDQNESDCPKVIATRDVKKGDVLTLFPIHALGLKNNIVGVEFHEFSSAKHEQLYNAGDAVRLNVPVSRKFGAKSRDGEYIVWNDPAAAVIGRNPAIRLVTISFPGEEVAAGWLGGVVKTTSSENETNCMNIPLLDASPFYAIVATCDIKEGDELIRATETTNWNLERGLQINVHDSHTKEFFVLRNHILKAFVGSFHQINLEYPGLKKIHREPDIYEIENFLTDDECDRIIDKIRPNLENQDIYYVEKADNFLENENKNYQSVMVPRREIPNVIDKLIAVTDCERENIGYAHCIHYEEGKMQQILSHVDSLQYSENFLLKMCEGDGAVGHIHHSIAIVFCYLNDVENGGDTFFNNLRLHVKPKRGTGLIHFPSDLDGRPDLRTSHQGSPAKDEKWLIAMTLFNTTEITHEYREFKLDPLSNDII